MILDAYSNVSCSRNAAAIARYSALGYTHNTLQHQRKDDVTIGRLWGLRNRFQSLSLPLSMIRSRRGMSMQWRINLSVYWIGGTYLVRCLVFRSVYPFLDINLDYVIFFNVVQQQEDGSYHLPAVVLHYRDDIEMYNILNWCTPQTPDNMLYIFCTYMIVR